MAHDLKARSSRSAFDNVLVLLDDFASGGMFPSPVNPDAVLKLGTAAGTPWHASPSHGVCGCGGS
ncbi:MAG TPA: hypothetical protein VGY30_03870, partial [Solirubrobacteraceae bacterium]|nr:hypothetical protein [Solirubrobacteraceae bacterium]